MSAPVGTTETARFGFTTRELTPAEQETFITGGGLPSGIGKDPESVKAEVQPPSGGAASKVEGGSVTKDAVGAYHFSLHLTEEGLYRFRGLGYTSGEQVTATPWFEVACGEDTTGTVADLVSSVLEDAQFDATEAQVLRWLDRAHRKMVERSRCYRKALTIGTTASGETLYPLPEGVIELLQVSVGSYVYGFARHRDYAEGELGYLWLGGTGGIAGRDDTASGESMLRLFPAPVAGQQPEPGAAIVVYAVMQPPALKIGQDAAIKVPDSYLDALVSGAIATGMLRMESRPDIAAPHKQAFDEGCSELLRVTNRKYRGTGPAQIRVIGINA